MTETNRTPPPVPNSVSEQAQRMLEQPPRVNTFPALGDTEGWLRLVSERDAILRERFAGTFPVDVTDTEIAGVHTYTVQPHDVPDDTGPIYLDLHGGALVFGGGEVCRLVTSATAASAGMLTWGVDYRMAPRHPYPAALDDCLAVYRELLAIRAPEDVIVGGGSAGGNLAAALMLRAKDEGLPLPAALVLLSPEVDLTESGDTFHTNLGIDTTMGSLREVNALYANGHDLADPYLSPLFGDVTGFPPTFLQSGTRDVFLSNTVRMHRKLLAADVPAELHVFEAMPHSGFGGTAPEDADLRTTARRFIDRHRRR